MNYCKNCGTQLKGGEVFCGSCGTQMTPTATLKENKGKKKKPIALISTIAAAIVVISIAAVMLLSGGVKGGENGADNENSPVIVEEPSKPTQIPNVSRIKSELSQDGRSFIPGTQTIDSVEILSEETGKEDEPWVHHATVLINSKDSEIAYVKYGIMVYQRNDEREWVLMDIAADSMNLWTISPLTGAQDFLVESSVREAILWQTVAIDGDDWKIDESTIESVTINNRNTDLTNRTDAVIVTVVLGSEAKTAQGQLELDFVFEYEWSCRGHRGNTPFASQYRPSAEFELTNENLIDELVRHDATVLREITWSGQTITMARNEISNFTIFDYESSNKGANRVYNFSFDLDKDIVMFAVDAQVSYSFNSMSGWTLNDFTFTPKLTSIAGLEGTRWDGTYRNRVRDRNYDGLYSIEIVEVTADGAFRAIASSETPTSFSQSLTGTINLTNLNMQFHLEEWIIKPEIWPVAYSLNNARGGINVQKSEIFSTYFPFGTSNNMRSFTVILTEETSQPIPAVEPDESSNDD